MHLLWRISQPDGDAYPSLLGEASSRQKCLPHMLSLMKSCLSLYFPGKVDSFRA
ncbi:hypothetical protein SLEP1_g2708 [Rubroshorea leprosula]|uniref:Uncharacterized protein n=1 Tax=Rubroshorea leprosula TaxID=152421 RepID=A0AAV5HNU8_9ROSI|nr:hypothetical protein SLEP1_g2708 [Rubroshorea leprosula]